MAAGGTDRQLGALVARVAVVVLTLAACSSDADEAADLVRDACELALPNVPTADLPTRSPEEAVRRADEHAAAFEEAANLSARAARLDPAWDELADAYAHLSDGWTFAASLTVTPTRAQSAQLYELGEQARPAEAEVRASCRRVG